MRGAPHQHAALVAMYLAQLTPLDKFAIKITDQVGTFGFFILIFIWTVIWTGYNLVASEVPGLHLKAFDPFPAFVAYLLISNVIQILLMPLLMVGQNLQSRQAALLSQSDFELNMKAEKEVELVMSHLEYQNQLLGVIIEKLGITPEEIAAKCGVEGSWSTERVGEE